MNDRKKSFWNTYFLTLLAVTAVFLCLYHSFIFGGKMYAYADIGSDTLTQYLPIISHETDLLLSGTDQTYDLQAGLGQYCSGIFLKYLIPTEWPLLIFRGDLLNVGLLLSMYLKYAIICLFGLLFFRRLLKNEQAASVCALIWTFSGYAVLWGQHYHFLLAIMCFTIAIYGFQLFLEGDRKKYLVVPAMAILASSGYYFLYNSCFFFLVYGLAYLAYCGKRPLQILQKVGWFILAMAAAAAMAAAYLLPSVANFLASPRVSDVTAGIRPEDILYSPGYLLALLSRLLSSNLLGVGDSHTGPTNYYELAIISVSLLSVFSLVLLLQRKYAKRTAFLAVICTLSVCAPFVTRIVTFSYYSQRWTYMLCLAQVIAIGFAVREIFLFRTDAAFRKILLRTVIISDAVLLAIMIGLFLLCPLFGYRLSPKTCLLLGCITIMYNLFFLLAGRLPRVLPTLTILVVFELVVCNYATVNQRTAITVEQWRDSLYNDGTSEVVAWLRQQDDSLYRINKTYDSAGHNDAYIQGYNGLSVYNSTNASEAVNLFLSYDYPLSSGSTNWIRFNGDDLFSNSMLGVKYVITLSSQPIDSAAYENIYDDGQYLVYQNRYWLGFGYLYQEETTEAVFQSCSYAEKKALLTGKYYITGGTGQIQASGPRSGFASVVSTETVFLNHLENLQQSCVRDMVHSGNCFSGTVVNGSSTESMLCVPLIYSSNWEVSVDATAVEVMNVNGGLVGFRIPSGDHSFTITYHNDIYIWSLAISILSCTAAASALFFYYMKSSIRRKRDGKND